MADYEPILQQAAAEGTFDTTQWPTIFPHILDRLEYNIYNAFPPLTIPTPSANQPSQPSSSGAPPPSSPPQPQTPTMQPPTQIPLPPNTLPPPLQEIYTFISNSLRINFSEKPPHTVQRLAELILNPTQQHRFLYSYLIALDRIVCVSSTLDIFPLPVAEPPSVTTNGPLVNGTSSTASFNTDDTLGGALLTPIPWLRPGQLDEDSEHASPSPVTSPLSGRSSTPPGLEEATILTPSSDDSASSEGATAAGMLREGAMTQGELIRAEQQASSPPAPVGSLAVGTATGRAMSPALESEEEMPHARGPEAIGMEDTGPQAQGKEGVLDMEAAVGRRHGEHGHEREEGRMDGIDEEGRGKEGPRRDDDGDVVVTDVDGRTEEDKENRGEGEDTRSLATDNTAG